MTPLGILAIALAIVIGGVLVFRLHPFFVLVAAAFAVALLIPDAELSAGELVAEGFGKTARGIGIVVAMAAIRTKIRYSNVPSGLRGLGITMLITGLMALAFQCFAGIQL